MGFQSRQNLLQNLGKQCEQAAERSEQLEEKIKEEKSKREASGAGGMTREELLEKLKKLNE